MVAYSFRRQLMKMVKMKWNILILGHCLAIPSLFSKELLLIYNWSCEIPTNVAGDWRGDMAGRPYRECLLLKTVHTLRLIGGYRRVDDLPNPELKPLWESSTQNYFICPLFSNPDLLSYVSPLSLQSWMILPALQTHWQQQKVTVWLYIHWKKL